MEIQRTELDGLYIIMPHYYRNETNDEIIEIYNQNKFMRAGLETKFVQDNQSMSKKNVLRELHFQVEYPQVKLIRVINGRILDVAVDVRTESPTFGKWFRVILSSENRKQLYMSKGFAHGFYVLSDMAEISYKTTETWHPHDEIGIPWNDSFLSIDWNIGINEIPIVAPKDMNYKPFLETFAGMFKK